MIRSTLRRTTRSRQCAGCLRWIHPPAQYIEAVISPDHDDVGNATWWRAAECRECAVRYDRWPIPNGGVDQL